MYFLSILQQKLLILWRKTLLVASVLICKILMDKVGWLSFEMLYVNYTCFVVSVSKKFKYFDNVWQ